MNDDHLPPGTTHRDTRLAQSGTRDMPAVALHSSFEASVAGLEAAEFALAFDSGGSAVDAVLSLLPRGSRVLVSESWRGGTWSRHSWVRTLVPVAVDPTSLRSVESALAGGASAILVDTPSDPLLGIADLGALARLAHTAAALLIVDNSGLTGFFQKPLELGADLVLYSSVQALAGHVPAKAGLAAGRSAELRRNLSTIRELEASALSPGDAWFILQGLRTLHLRAQRAQDSARRIAQWLGRHPRVARVLHPQAPGHDDAGIHLDQATGAGWCLAFEVTTPWLAAAFLKSLKVWIGSDARGTCESTASHPFTGSHRDLPESTLRRLGIGESLIRLSVGLEDVEDLVQDLDQALRRPLEAGAGEANYVI